MADTNKTNFPSFEPNWSSHSRVWREYCVTFDVIRSGIPYRQNIVKEIIDLCSVLVGRWCKNQQNFRKWDSSVWS